MTDNTNIRNTFNGPDGLQSKINEPQEYGNAFKRNPGYDSTEPIDRDFLHPSFLRMSNYVGGNYYGANHTHLNPSLGFVPMFAADDIKYLLDVSRRHNTNGQPKDYSLYVLTLTVSQGTFAIKIKDSYKFTNAMNQYYYKVKEKLENKYDSRDAISNIDFFKKDLINIFNQYDMGLGLYQANTDLTEWSEIVVDVNMPTGLKLIPCN